MSNLITVASVTVKIADVQELDNAVALGQRYAEYVDVEVQKKGFWVFTTALVTFTAKNSTGNIVVNEIAEAFGLV